MQLLDGSGSEAVLALKLKVVVFPLGGDERVEVVGQSGRESMISKPFVQAFVGGVKIVLFGGEEGAVHVGVQKSAEVNRSCRSARVTIKWSSSGKWEVGSSRVRRWAHPHGS